jgi:hypothetical protein
MSFCQESCSWVGMLSIFLHGHMRKNEENFNLLVCKFLVKYECITVRTYGYILELHD